MAQSFNTNLFNVAKHYVQALKLQVTQTTLKESLEQNAYYPSLYSLSKVFDKFNLANEAYTVDEESLNRFEPPFITYCSEQNTGKDFVLVTEITGSTVSYIADGNKPKQVNREDFVKQWQKIVFVAEAGVNSGEADYKAKVKIKKSKKQKQALSYAGVAFLTGLMIFPLIYNASTAYLLAASTITVIKLLGLAATVLLLIYEIDKTNSFVKSICTAGKQTNCDAVINSRAGKILGMSWAEAGFFYFASTTMFLLFPGLAFVYKLPWLAIAGTLAAPYIVFSIYYQWQVVKKWCPLCLAVQAVLLMELTWAFINFWSNKNPSLQSSLTSSAIPPPWEGIGEAVFCLLLPFSLWYLLKPLLLAAKAAPGYNAAYKRLLYNPEIFNGLLQQQPAAPGGWQQLGINIGNPDAANTIIKVCNPYCGPCAKVHPVLEEIIKHNKDMQVKVIFTATNNENDPGAKPVKHLLAVAAKENKQLTEQALDDWYLPEKKDYDAFAAKYPMNGEFQEQVGKLDMMKAWCEEAEITFTPTIFINGRRLPETYSIDELKNIL